MRKLIRSTEGEIGKQEFMRGFKFVSGLTLLLLALIIGLFFLNKYMDWMTVAIAPIIGGIVFIAVCSILYFWFCLFIKRFRGMGQPLSIVYLWLLLPIVAGIFRLVQYEIETLKLTNLGILSLSGTMAIIFEVQFVAISLILLYFCITGPDEKIETVTPLPDITDEK